MSYSKDDINELIRSRRAVFPQMYNKEEITDTEIRDILENANWAPTHKKTEPWRFVVFRNEALASLGDWLASKYRETATNAGDYSDVKFEKFRQRPQQSGCALGICMRRDPQKRLPEWEELAAMACAVQNMWLTCTAYGIGSYWSTPGFVVNAPDFPHLKDDWQCKGLFYMGRWDKMTLPASRTPIEEKIVWVD
jgi:nitroreductase